jgi:hypothetical protein
MIRRPRGYRSDAGDSKAGDRSSHSNALAAALTLQGWGDRVEPRDDLVTLKNRHEAARTPAGRRSVNVVLILLSRRASRGRVFLKRPVSYDLVLRVRVGVGHSRCSVNPPCRPAVDPQ